MSLVEIRRPCRRASCPVVFITSARLDNFLITYSDLLEHCKPSFGDVTLRADTSIALSCRDSKT